MSYPDWEEVPLVWYQKACGEFVLCWHPWEPFEC